MEQQKLPNVTISLILSIVGFLCCCFAGLGIIPAGIAYFLVSKDEKLVAENPDTYSNESLLKTTKIITYVVLVLNLLYLIRSIYVIATVGFDGLQQQFDIMQQQIEAGGY